MRISFFGSSLVSAYWNGAATYYRGILRALAARGHAVTFYEPDAYDRQKHRDIPDPPWARVVVYSAEGEAGVRRALAAGADADLVVKASGVGAFDALLEAAVLELRRPDGTRPLCAFWDVDAPATLERVRDAEGEATPDPFGALIPRYDVVFTYGGGPPVVAAYEALGAQRCVPIYNGLDPDIHRPAEPDGRFTGDLGFLANRLPDREARVEEFFLRAAAALPERVFVLGGSGWHDKAMPPNVRAVGHVYTRDHNAFNASTTAVLNVNRDSMARFGYSPATRVFEAAGAGACVVTDAFVGVETFFAPDREILVARDGAEVARILAALTPGRAREIGAASRRRALGEHTYDQRALRVEAVLDDLRGEAEGPARVVAGASA
ncbi:MAG: glycosyltransferase [Polyangia bacterium]